MAKSLRKRVTLAIIIPLVLGMIILTTVTCVPLYIQYNGYIDDYNNHMVSNEKNTMKSLSIALSNTESYGIFSYVASLAQLSGALIADYYYGRIRTSGSTPSVIIPESQVGPNTGIDFAVGYSTEPIFNFTQDMQYKNSSAFYYFMQPMVALGQKYDNTVIATHVTFNNDFFMFMPGNLSLFDSVTKESLAFNESTWWNQSINAAFQTAFVHEDYTMICHPLYMTGHMGTLPCIVYSLSSFQNEIKRSFSDNEETAIVDQELQMYYPLDDYNISYCAYAFQEECPHPVMKEASKEAHEYYEKNFLQDACEIGDELGEKRRLTQQTDEILPQGIYDAIYYHNATKQFEIEANGQTTIISISPFNISFPLLQTYDNEFSVILNTTKSNISQKFDKLQSNLTITIIVQVAVFLSVLIVMIVFVCVISYRITGSILAPIDDLYNILQRLHTDLGVDVKSYQKKGPPEIINLYEVFDKLRLILRFEDSSLFSDPAYAMMNYAQALRLFNDFNNKAAMEICYEEIGHIHMKYGRFMEAAINYHSSYSLAEELDLNPVKIAEKKVNTAKALMAAKVKTQKAKELFLDALTLYEAHDFHQRTLTYLDFAECLLLNNENAEPEINKIESSLHRLPENSEAFIILQRFLYLKGLLSFNKKHLRQAADYLTDSLENYPFFDHSTRKKCLVLLKKIFKQSGLPSDQLVHLESSLVDCPKDIVLVIDSKIGGALNDEVLQEFASRLVKPADRMSFIQFDESCQTLFNLTRLPRRRCSTSSSLFDLRNVCVLNDAILCALRQILSIKSLVPKSFLSNESPHREWIVVVTHGQDNGSQASDHTLTKELYGSSASIIIVAVTPDEETIRKLSDITKITPSGILIRVNDFSNIQNGLHLAQAYILQNEDVMV